MRAMCHGFAAAVGKAGALVAGVVFNLVDDRGKCEHVYRLSWLGLVDEGGSALWRAQRRAADGWLATPQRMPCTLCTLCPSPPHSARAHWSLTPSPTSCTLQSGSARRAALRACSAPSSSAPT